MPTIFTFRERFARTAIDPSVLLEDETVTTDPLGFPGDSATAQRHFERVELLPYLREAQSYLWRLRKFRDIRLGFTMEEIPGFPWEGQLACGRFVWKASKDTSIPTLGSFVLYHPMQEKVIVRGLEH